MKPLADKPEIVLPTVRRSDRAAMLGQALRGVLFLVVFTLHTGCTSLSSEANAEHRAKLAEAERELAESRRRLHEVLNPPDADHTRGLAATCPVHHSLMQARRVSITYGLIRRQPPQPSHETQTAAFPFGERFVWGGCAGGKGMPRHAKIYLCPACVEARRRWQSEAANLPSGTP